MGLVRPESAYLLRNVVEVQHDHPTHFRDTDRGGRVERCRAVFVGRLIAAKRVDRFLHALAIARRQDPTLEGVVVGDGPCRAKGEQLAENLGLIPDGVCFTGRRNDVSDKLKQADMLVLCSDREGLPNVILEAMATGLPVVTTPVGDTRFVVDNGVSGYVVPPDDPGAIAARMVELARSPGLRRQFGESGLRKVKREYGLESLPGQLMAAYRGVATRTGYKGLLAALGDGLVV
jgi:glycosyltransferase involved in cell wall biosynthesis